MGSHAEVEDTQRDEEAVQGLGDREGESQAVRVFALEQPQERQTSRRLRKSTQLKVSAESRRIRFALLEHQNVNPDTVHAEKLAAVAEHAREAGGSGPTATDTEKS